MGRVSVPEGKASWGWWKPSTERMPKRTPELRAKQFLLSRPRRVSPLKQPLKNGLSGSF